MIILIFVELDNRRQTMYFKEDEPIRVLITIPLLDPTYKGSYWRIELFSHMYEYKGDIYYACVMSSYKECIPYNDETKRLVNTTEEAPEYYRYWED